MLGGFEVKEDKVRPPQTLLSSNWIRGAVAVRSKGQGKSPPPIIIAQSRVRWDTHHLWICIHIYD